MKSRIVWALVALNALLLTVLVSQWLKPNVAVAQFAAAEPALGLHDHSRLPFREVRTSCSTSSIPRTACSVPACLTDRSSRTWRRSSSTASSATTTPKAAAADSDVSQSEEPMNKQTYTIGILSLTAAVLLVANLMMPCASRPTLPSRTAITRPSPPVSRSATKFSTFSTAAADRWPHSTTTPAERPWSSAPSSPFRTPLPARFRRDNLTPSFSGRIFTPMQSAPRHDWTRDEVQDVYSSPLLELIYRAATVHRRHHDPGEVQVCKLISIKTGGCPEDCTYCSAVLPLPDRSRSLPADGKGRGARDRPPRQRRRRQPRLHGRGLARSPRRQTVRPRPRHGQGRQRRSASRSAARSACSPKTRPAASKRPGSTPTTTTSTPRREYYATIITTRTYDDRLKTLENVRKTDVTVCCGGIIGLGETERRSRLHAAHAWPR